MELLGLGNTRIVTDYAHKSTSQTLICVTSKLNTYHQHQVLSQLVHLNLICAL